MGPAVGILIGTGPDKSEQLDVTFPTKTDEVDATLTDAASGFRVIQIDRSQTQNNGVLLQPFDGMSSSEGGGTNEGER